MLFSRHQMPHFLPFSRLSPQQLPKAVYPSFYHIYCMRRQRWGHIRNIDFYHHSELEGCYLQTLEWDSLNYAFGSTSACTSCLCRNAQGILLVPLIHAISSGLSANSGITLSTSCFAFFNTALKIAALMIHLDHFRFIVIIHNIVVIFYLIKLMMMEIYLSHPEAFCFILDQRWKPWPSGLLTRRSTG